MPDNSFGLLYEIPTIVNNMTVLVAVATVGCFAPIHRMARVATSLAIYFLPAVACRVSLSFAI